MALFRRSSFRSAFTLVELLVVIAVIAILMGLLVPAVGAVREAGRLMQCRGNLRQLAQACTNYANARGFLPPPGNSFGRLGDPNTAVGPRGGWLYAILPFVEKEPLYDLGAGLTGTDLDTALRTRIGTAVPLYTCANRGSALFTAPPVVPGISYQSTSLRTFNPIPPPPAPQVPALLARSDYAGCMASMRTDDASSALGAHPVLANSGNMIRRILDGHSNVFLCGERYLSPNEYRPAPLSSPTDWVNLRRECNNKGWSVTTEGDVYATVSRPPLSDNAGIPDCGTLIVPLDLRNVGRFGSAHDGVPMAMVDGSVHVVAFNIDPALFLNLGIMDNALGAADELK